mmetsp:Transcript_129942/g.183290  ORF Transcript_129942/g.183290 Transcript_129942/m.183290 type:complete len:91 (-) Transcript_129942:251-523(-)
MVQISVETRNWPTVYTAARMAISRKINSYQTNERSYIVVGPQNTTTSLQRDPLEKTICQPCNICNLPRIFCVGIGGHHPSRKHLRILRTG